MIAMLLNFPFIKQIGMGLILVIVVSMFFGVRSCNKKKNNKALLEHNNKKLEESVDNSLDKIKGFSEIQKYKNKQETKFEVKKTILKKNCLKDCEVVQKKLSKEEIKEKRNKALRELKQNFSF